MADLDDLGAIGRYFWCRKANWSRRASMANAIYWLLLPKSKFISALLAHLQRADLSTVECFRIAWRIEKGWEAMNFMKRLGARFCAAGIFFGLLALIRHVTCFEDAVLIGLVLIISAQVIRAVR